MVVTRTHHRLHQAHGPADELRGPGPRRPRHHRRDPGRGRLHRRTCSRPRTHDHVLLFTTRPGLLQEGVRAAEGSRTSKGRAIVKRARPPGRRAGRRDAAVHRVSAPTPACSSRPSPARQEDRSCRSSENVRQSGIKAITVENGGPPDQGELTTKAHDVLLTSAKGFAVRFTRIACGRWAGPPPACAASRCAPTTACSGCPRSCATSRRQLITVCERGYGKAHRARRLSTQERGGKGVITIKTTAATAGLRGPVAPTTIT